MIVITRAMIQGHFSWPSMRYFEGLRGALWSVAKLWQGMALWSVAELWQGRAPVPCSGAFSKGLKGLQGVF